MGSYYYYPFIGEDNKPYQYLAIRTDISQQKLIKEKIINSIIYSQEKDRNYASEDLHEGLSQTLAGLNFHLNFIESNIEGINNDDLKNSVSLIKKYIHESISKTRSLAAGLMPRSLIEKGLTPATKQHLLEIKNTLGHEIEFNGQFENDIDKEIEITIYRAVEFFLKITQETKDITKIIIDLTDTPSIQVNIEFMGNSSLFLNKKNEIKAIQKRVELLDGQIVIHQNSTKKSTIISITF